jgi:hypothetical protein
LVHEVRIRPRGSRLDLEVRELLGTDPELLALAELIASLPPEELGLPKRAKRRSRERMRSVRSAFSVMRHKMRM